MGIEIRNLEAAYEDRVIIPCANVTIPEGKITMMIGPNGCGKSTLLKSIARILPIKKGEVLLDGTNIKKLSQKLIAQKMADHEIIEWAMQRTGVFELKDRKVEELSGGQRQRVWISLTLAQKTNILILDEPTTYLDMAHQLEILELLQTLNAEEHTTIIMVIHELNHAAKFADHIIGMRQGRILFEGSPNDVIHVENLRKLYEIEAVLIQNEKKGYPVCIDYSRKQS